MSEIASLEQARDTYMYRPSSDSMLAPSALRDIVDILSARAIGGSDKLHLGWAAIELAHHPETEPAEAAQLFDQADLAWRNNLEGEVSPRTAIHSATALAYIPTFRETLHADNPLATMDWDGLLKRLRKANDAAITITGQSAAQEGVVVASQKIAVLAMIARMGRRVSRQARRQQTNNPNIPLAWPAASWQEARRDPQTRTIDPGASFGLLFSHLDDQPPQRVEVVPFQYCRKVERAGIDRNDTKAMEIFWRERYDPDTTLIFGDVHLGASRRHPLAANSILQNSDRYGDRLGSITNTIFQTLGLAMPQ